MGTITTRTVPLPPQELNPYWEAAQPGFKFSNAPPGSSQFFADVEHHRYTLEPHIPELARFEEWGGRHVLEVGCGIATDGIRFARAGASYTGVDQAEAALRLAGERFAREGRQGRFVRALATELPFGEEFDFVYSHGVLHHLSDTEGALREIHRVLRPGGTVLVMLYHRHSLNYLFTIMVLRRLFAVALYSSLGTRIAMRITGEPEQVFEGHRRLLREHGIRYLVNRELFLSNNTDGPGNPLSKVFSRRAAQRMLRAAGFENTACTARYLNLRVLPAGERLAGTPIARRLERRIGWHLYLTATKPWPSPDQYPGLDVPSRAGRGLAS